MFVVRDRSARMLLNLQRDTTEELWSRDIAKCHALHWDLISTLTIYCVNLLRQQMPVGGDRI